MVPAFGWPRAGGRHLRNDQKYCRRHRIGATQAVRVSVSTICHSEGAKSPEVA